MEPLHLPGEHAQGRSHSESDGKQERAHHTKLPVTLAVGPLTNGLVNHLSQSNLNYEQASREPPLPILLDYARAARVYVDVLIDDI